MIGKLRTEGGYTILVIEHDMHVVEGISDRVVALDHGVKIAEGSFDTVATTAKVIEAYLGLNALPPRQAHFSAPRRHGSTAPAGSGSRPIRRTCRLHALQSPSIDDIAFRPRYASMTFGVRGHGVERALGDLEPVVERHNTVGDALDDVHMSCSITRIV